MQEKEKKAFFRLMYRQTFGYLGTLLVLSLLAGTLLGGGIYRVNALCAAGFVMIAWAWFHYLSMTGMNPFGRGKKRPRRKVPYLYRRFKEQKRHRPAFRMNSEDFDDDLTSATVVSPEQLTENQAQAAQALAKALCGVLLVIISFLVPLG